MTISDWLPVIHNPQPTTYNLPSILQNVRNSDEPDRFANDSSANGCESIFLYLNELILSN